MAAQIEVLGRSAHRQQRQVPGLHAVFLDEEQAALEGADVDQGVRGHAGDRWRICVGADDRHHAARGAEHGVGERGGAGDRDHRIGDVVGRRCCANHCDRVAGGQAVRRCSGHRGRSGHRAGAGDHGAGAVADSLPAGAVVGLHVVLTVHHD